MGSNKRGKSLDDFQMPGAVPGTGKKSDGHSSTGGIDNFVMPLGDISEFNKKKSSPDGSTSPDDGSAAGGSGVPPSPGSTQPGTTNDAAPSPAPAPTPAPAAAATGTSSPVHLWDDTDGLGSHVSIAGNNYDISKTQPLPLVASPEAQRQAQKQLRDRVNSGSITDGDAAVLSRTTGMPISKVKQAVNTPANYDYSKALSFVDQDLQNNVQLSKIVKGTPQYVSQQLKANPNYIDYYTKSRKAQIQSNIDEIQRQIDGVRSTQTSYPVAGGGLAGSFSTGATTTETITDPAKYKHLTGMLDAEQKKMDDFTRSMVMVKNLNENAVYDAYNGGTKKKFDRAGAEAIGASFKKTFDEIGHSNDQHQQSAGYTLSQATQFGNARVGYEQRLTALQAKIENAKTKYDSTGDAADGSNLQSIVSEYRKTYDEYTHLSDQYPEVRRAEITQAAIDLYGNMQDGERKALFSTIDNNEKNWAKRLQILGGMIGYTKPNKEEMQSIADQLGVSVEQLQKLDVSERGYKNNAITQSGLLESFATGIYGNVEEMHKFANDLRPWTGIEKDKYDNAQIDKTIDQTQRIGSDAAMTQRPTKIDLNRYDRFGQLNPNFTRTIQNDDYGQPGVMGDLNLNPTSVIHNVGDLTAQTAIFALGTELGGGVLKKIVGASVKGLEAAGAGTNALLGADLEASSLSDAVKAGWEKGKTALENNSEFLHKAADVNGTIGSSIAVGYDNYYKAASQYTTSEKKRQMSALANGFIDGLTEVVGIQDVNLARSITGDARLFRAFDRILGENGGVLTRRGLIDYMKIAGKAALVPFVEGLEEVESAYGQAGADKLILGKKFDKQQVAKDATQQFVSAFIGTVPSGVGAMRGSMSRMKKESMFEIGNQASDYRDFIGRQVLNGKMNQADANEAIRKINTMEGIVKNMPYNNPDGKPYTIDQKIEIAAQQYRIMQNEAAKKNGNAPAALQDLADQDTEDAKNQQASALGVERPEEEEEEPLPSIDVDKIQAARKEDNDDIDKELADLDPLNAQDAKRIQSLEKQRAAINDYYDQQIKGKVQGPSVDAVSDDEYNAFIDKNEVSKTTLHNIAEKVKNREDLSEREKAIFHGKTGDINDIIAHAAAGGQTIGVKDWNDMTEEEQERASLAIIGEDKRKPAAEPAAGQEAPQTEGMEAMDEEGLLPEAPAAEQQEELNPEAALPEAPAENENANVSIENGKQVTFRPANKNTEITGTSISLPSHPDLHVVAVEDAKSGDQLLKHYHIYEVTTGKQLVATEAATPEEAAADADEQLNKKGVTADKIYDAIDSGKVKAVNPTEGYQRYQDKKEQERQTLPYLYNDEERGQIQSLIDEYKDKALPEHIKHLQTMIDYREQPGYSRKQKVGMLRNWLDNGIKDRDQKERQANGLPFEKDQIEKVGEDFDTFKSVYDPNKSNRFATLETHPGGKELLKLAFAAWQKIQRRRNEYGYFDGKDKEWTTPFLQLMGAMNARNEKRKATVAPLIQQITKLLSDEQAKPATGTKLSDGKQEDDKPAASAESGTDHSEEPGEETPTINVGRKGGWTPKSQREIRDPRIRRAMGIETNDPYDQVVQFFVGNGSMNINSAMKELYGTTREGKMSPAAVSEYNPRLGLHHSEGPTISGLAHILWERHRPAGEFDTEKFDTQDYHNAVEAVLSDFSGRGAMTDYLLKKYDEEAISPEESEQQKWYESQAAPENYDHENEVPNVDEIREAAQIAAGMTDDEINEILQLDSEKISDGKMADHIDELRDTYFPQDLGADEQEEDTDRDERDPRAGSESSEPAAVQNDDGGDGSREGAEPVADDRNSDQAPAGESRVEPGADDQALAGPRVLGAVSAEQTPEQKATAAQLAEAQKELSAATTSFTEKKKELDKGLRDDQPDLFGNRKSGQNAGLFDERADPSVRQTILEPYKARVQKAKTEVERLAKKLEDLNGKPSAQTDLQQAIDEANAITSADDQIPEGQNGQADNHGNEEGRGSSETAASVPGSADVAGNTSDEGSATDNTVRTGADTDSAADPIPSSETEENLNHDTGTTSDLEPDSTRRDTEDEIRPTLISPSGRPNNERPAADGTNVIDADQSPIDSPGLLPFDATTMGEQGDPGLSGEEQYVEPAGSTAGPAISGRSSEDDGTGIQSASGQDASTEGITGTEPGQSTEAKLKAQEEAESLPVVSMDMANIRATLPYLKPEQQEDVYKAERRFIQDGEDPKKQYGKGYLFTNGTGTGKTMTGLGIAKRFLKQGKSNILFVTPTDLKCKDWIDEGKLLHLPITQLSDASSRGEGPIVTTYANFHQNEALHNQDWDLIVYDESHKITSEAKGKYNATTEAHEKAGLNWYQAEKKATERIIGPAPEGRFTADMTDKEAEALSKLHQAYRAKQEAHAQEIDQLAHNLIKNTKVVFLSATPFSYHPNLKYADGFLYTISNHIGNEARAHKRNSDYNDFMIRNFGYRMRFNKLTSPEADVDVALMEMQFADRLKQSGVMSGRSLKMDQDYSRDFVMMDDKMGQLIDEGVSVMRSSEFKELGQLINKKLTHIAQLSLLESLKAVKSVDRIKQHLALGRKVVVFHDFNNVVPTHPFTFDDPTSTNMLALNDVMKKELDLFNKKYPQYKNLDMRGLDSPLQIIRKHFKNALFVNGDVPAAQRVNAVKMFNSDNSGQNIIVFQSAAGAEGNSLHDKTGKMQRVLINLGLPTRPTIAIQIEGRTYRLGTQTDAIYEYPVLGLNLERFAFATTIAKRTSTAENLALGSDARDLETAYKEGYINAQPIPVSNDQGKGGKASDTRREQMDDFDKARSYYYSRQKGRKDVGTDYFATPEPLGYKMVQWGGARDNEKQLEPSAGHAAIARWFSRSTNNTAIEPNDSLRAETAMVMDGETLAGTFEDLHSTNKYNVITMNPPFGKGGKTAMEHLVKATNHLREGGRVTALVPQGPAMQKRIDQWLESKESNGYHIRANIKLPTIAFNRAGTSVSTQIFIIDKVSDKKEAAKLGSPLQVDLSHITDEKEFFDTIRDLDMPKRVAVTGDETAERNAPKLSPEPAQTAPVQTQEAAQDSPKTEDSPQTPGNGISSVVATKNTKTGTPIWIVKLDKRVGANDFTNMREAAKLLGGSYSRFRSGDVVPGFLFNDEKSANDFNGVVNQEVNEEGGKEAKRLSDIIRSLKLDPRNTYALPIPPVVWNTAVELVAKAVEGGEALVDALKTGLAHVRSHYQNSLDLKGYTNDIIEALKANGSLKYNLTERQKGEGDKVVRNAQRGANLEEQLRTIQAVYDKAADKARQTGASESQISYLGKSFDELKRYIHDSAALRQFEEEGNLPPIQEPAQEEAQESEEPADTEQEQEDLQDLDKLTSHIPNGGNVGEYLSKGTIELRHGETPVNDQSIINQELRPALQHGVKIVDQAKQMWGDDFVEKTLDYIESSHMDVATRALVYVSLENELMHQKQDAGGDDIRRIQKLQDLVRARSQAYLRQASLAINFGRLRRFAQAGFDVNNITDQFFSSRDKEDMKGVEGAMQADSKQINDAAAERDGEDEDGQEPPIAPDIEQKIKEGVDSEIAKLYEKMPTERKKQAMRYISALEKVQQKLRGNAYGGIALPIAILDASITTIKNAIKAGVALADAVEVGVKQARTWFEKQGQKWDKEEQFRQDLLEGFGAEGIQVKDKKDKTNSERLTDAKQQLQKKIDDVREQIANKERNDPERKKLHTDREYERMKQDFDSLVSLRDKYLPKEEDHAEERAYKSLKNRLTNDIIDLNDQIEAGEKRKRNPVTDKAETEEISRLRQEKKRRQDILNELDPKTDAERLQEAKAALQKRMDGVRQEIADKQRKADPKKLVKDTEYLRMQEDLKSLQALRDKYLPKEEEYTDEKRMKGIKNRLTSDIMDLNDQIRAGERRVAQKFDRADSEEVQKLREQKKQRQEILEALDPSPHKFVRQALMSAGYGKTINATVTRTADDGTRTKEKVQRQILDWKKLAGEEGSVDKIDGIVGKVLADKGFSPEQILRLQDKFKDEYHDLRTRIVERKITELTNRNGQTVTPDQKSSARKLAELYNYGLFEQDPGAFTNLLTRALGIQHISPERFAQVESLAKSLQSMYATKFNGRELADFELKPAIQKIEEQISHILHEEAQQHGSTPLKLANWTRAFMDASQRMMLVSMKQAVENPLSGGEQNLISNLGYNWAGSKEFDAQRRAAAASIYKDMVLNGGTGFGDVSTTFANRGSLEASINKMSDNQLYHAVASTLIGTTTLDAADAFFKSKLTEKKFAYNLIKILTKARLVEGKLQPGMTKEQAAEYVTEKLTGQSLSDAKQTAEMIINKVNSDAGKMVLNDSRFFVDRLANDIVKAALVNGEKISSDQVMAAYHAAYKAAGSDLGHEPNNPLSSMVQATSSGIERKITQAIKEKKYNKAAALTMKSVIFRNILNPFVGGGTNWVMLKLEKNGLGLFSGLYYHMKRTGIDMTSEAGMKQLEEGLYDDMRARDSFLRGAIGGGVAALGAMLIQGVANTDEYRRWRLRNMWAAKYLDLITPEIILATMSARSKQMGYYLENLFNHNDSFDKENKFFKGVDQVAQGKDAQGVGKIGEAIGGNFNTPLPWRLVRDVQQIYQGTSGQDVWAPDQDPSLDLMSGAIKGGFLDYIGARKSFDEQMKDAISNKTIDEKQAKSFENRSIYGQFEDHHPEVDQILEQSKRQLVPHDQMLEFLNMVAEKESNGELPRGATTKYKTSLVKNQKALLKQLHAEQ